MRLIQTLCLAGLMLAPISASAVDYSTIYFFGDSLTDEGRNGRTAPVMWPGVLRTDTTVFQGANFAIGGATTSNQLSLQFGDSSYLGQVNSFLNSGVPIGPKTAAGIWIGTNNIQIGAAQNQSASVLSQSALADIRAGMQQLANAGIKEFVILGVYDLSLTNALGAANATTLTSRSTAAAASQQLNAQLANLSIAGTTIRYFDIAAFINQLQMNPKAYGFQQILPLPVGASCNATCQQTSIFSDQIHLTSKTQQLVGDYIAGDVPLYNGTFNNYGVIFDNVASSSASILAPAPLAASATGGFASTMFDRFDAMRSAGQREARAQVGPARMEPPSRWSAFVLGDVAGGRLSDSRVLPNQTDMNFTATGQTAGLQYNLFPDTKVGVALNHTYLKSDLGSTINTTTKMNSYQAAFFASLGDSTRFLDGTLIFGSHEGSQTRNGSFGELQSSPGGRSLALAVRGGFLSPVGPVRIGPVAGVSVTRMWMDGYVEQGGGMYAMGVAGQTADILIGSAGVQMRTTGLVAWPFDPFATITYERSFAMSSQSISSYLVSLPTQQFQTLVPTAGANALKISLGSYVKIGESWDGFISGYGFGSDQGAYGAGAAVGLNHKF